MGTLAVEKLQFGVPRTVTTCQVVSTFCRKDFLLLHFYRTVHIFVTGWSFKTIAEPSTVS